MTKRQQRFIDEYIRTGNAALSARLVGYAEKSCNVTGAKLLAKSNIAAEVQKRLDEVKSERVATLTETLEFITAVLRGEVREKTALSVGTGKSSRVEVIDLPPKVRDRLRAAEFLHKILSVDKEKEPLTIHIVSVDAEGTERQIL